MTRIWDNAFKDCTSLTDVVIPAGVTSIDLYAFQRCKNLRTVFIPVGVTSIGFRAFNDCDYLATVTYGGTMAEWETITKGDFIFLDTRVTEIICSDGTLTL